MSQQIAAIELRTTVDRINAAYPGAVHFEVRGKMASADRLQLWLASHVMLNTALRESINVHPLEFVWARHVAGKPAGVVVLSEFTGFGRVLNGCLRVKCVCRDSNSGRLRALCSC